MSPCVGPSGAMSPCVVGTDSSDCPNFQYLGLKYYIGVVAPLVVFGAPID